MVTDRAITVLVTGAGAPGIRGTLYALKHNPDGFDVRTIGVDLNPNAVGRFLVDSFHEIPPPEESTYIDRLCTICRSESVDIVVPQTTREIEVLSQQREALTADGIRVMVSSASAVARANDKGQVLQVFKELGLPFPDYIRVRSENELLLAAQRLGYPNRAVVVKPPVSNGMRGVRVIQECSWDVERFLKEKPSGLEITLDELLSMLRRGHVWPELLIMEYLPGPEYTVDAFVGEQASIALPRLRAVIRSGISFETHLEDRADLADFTLRAAQHMGLRYAFGFQFKLGRDKVPRVLECNPRIQGTMVASVHAGVNVIWLAVRELLGDGPTEITAPDYAARFYRYWGGVGVTGERVVEI